MQRYHIPFDHIEEHWTMSQYLCLLTVMMEGPRGSGGGVTLGDYTKRCMT